MSKFLKVLVIFLTVFQFVSCLSVTHSKEYFSKNINNIPSVSSKNLNLDGAFNGNNDTTNFVLERPFYFFENGLTYCSDATITSDEKTYNCSSYQKKSIKDQSFNWGIFEIIGDTIKAYIDFVYYGPPTIIRLTTFQGILKGRDTILDWHMVEPFPKLNKNLKEGYSHLMTEHRMLYSKPVYYKRCMDSVAKEIWINKYRIPK
jgi:hypothetical protein